MNIEYLYFSVVGNFYFHEVSMKVALYDFEIFEECYYVINASLIDSRFISYLMIIYDTNCQMPIGQEISYIEQFFVLLNGI